MNRALGVIACIFMVFGSVQAQTKTAKPGPEAGAESQPASAKEAKLPSSAEIEASLKRTLGYDATLTWTILEIRPSAIVGIAEAVVSLNKQTPVHLFFSSDTNNVIIGNVIPFGSNPFAPARELLKAADGPAFGAANPAIRVVEFSDLECPHCKTAQPILEKLATEFPQVRFTFQQFPLPASVHPWAMKAAQYADCSAQSNKDAFPKYVDSIFENQAAIELSNADKKLQELAGTAGLDATKMASCAAAPETEVRIKKSLALGQSLEVTETPTIFINGRRVTALANIPYEQLKTLVQFEIEHADK